MNRFRRRKEAKELSEGSSNSSTESENLPFPAAIKVFRLGKKTLEPEPKAQIDLTSALPPSDNFRTSLLMNGLSARFSMLREQDDPNSKLGKASDDSVMYPIRNSRFGLLDHQSELSDIMEVSSLNTSFHGSSENERPTSNVSLPSFNKGDDFSPNQSIMNRSRPGEQNNLFGGRQKINVGNRTLYEADVRSTAYREERRRQRGLYQQEKNYLANYSPTSKSEYDIAEENASQDNLHLAPKEFSIPSTSAVNNEKSTQDEISSKSFMLSASPNFSINKIRRLYEAGSDNALQERQSLATNKIDTFASKRSFISSAPSPVSSSGNSPVQNDRFDQQMIKSRISNHVSSLTKGLPIVKKFELISPPLSPPEAKNEEEYDLPIGTCSLKHSKLSNHILNQLDDGTKDNKNLSQSGQNIDTSNQSLSLESTDRERTDSQSRFFSKKVFSNYSAQASQLGHLKPGLVQDYRTQVRTGSKNTLATSPKNEPLRPRTNFSAPLPSQFRSHSDLRSSSNLENKLKPSGISSEAHGLSKSMSQNHLHGAYAENRSSCSSSEAPNSTVLPSTKVESKMPQSSEIIGMVRKHMRFESDASSNYGMSSNDEVLNFTQSQPNNNSNEYLTQANPWGDSYDEKTEAPIQQNELFTNPSNESYTNSPPSSKEMYDPSGNSKNTNNFMEKELEMRHTRHASTDTQREQQTLQDELASRRRYVQEKMRNFVESDNYSVNPMSSDYSRDVLRNGTFGLLRTKNSRGTIKINDKENQIKTIKSLSHSNISLNHQSPFSKNPYHEEENEGDETFSGKLRPFSPQSNRTYSPRLNFQSERHIMLNARHEKSEIKICK